MPNVLKKTVNKDYFYIEVTFFCLFFHERRKRCRFQVDLITYYLISNFPRSDGLKSGQHIAYRHAYESISL